MHLSSSLGRWLLGLLALLSLARLGHTAFQPFALREALHFTPAAAKVRHDLCQAMAHCHNLTTDLIRVRTTAGGSAWGCRVAIQLGKRSLYGPYAVSSDAVPTAFSAQDAAAETKHLLATSKDARLRPLAAHIVVHVFDTRGQLSGSYAEGVS